MGGIQFPDPCDKSPLEQTPVTVPDEPTTQPVTGHCLRVRPWRPTGQQDDFQIEVDALHQVVRKMFADLVEVIQGFSEDFPTQMQVVLQRLSGEFGSRPDHPRPQQPVRIQQAATANRFFPQLRPGDICRYQGPQGAMNVTCRGRQLCVLEINGEVATVNALPDYFHKGEWSHPHEIEIRHLRKVK